MQFFLFISIYVMCVIEIAAITKLMDIPVLTFGA